MSLRVAEVDRTIEIQVTESLTKYDVAKYHEELITLVEKGKPIIINLQNVMECDTAGIQLLVSTKKTVDAKNINLTIDLFSSAVKNVMEQIGISQEKLGTINT